MSTIKDQFVPFELAVKLKDLGFNEHCLGYYYINELNKIETDFTMYLSLYVLKAPLWQQAFDWFIDKGFEHWLNSSNDTWYFNIKPVGKVLYWDLELTARKGFNTREEARQACLEKLIEIIP